MSTEESPREGPTPATRSGQPRQAHRFPAWLVIPLAGGAGFLTASWLGLIFGVTLGYFLFRTRS